MPRTAVITGGSRGLGAELVRRLEGNGWRVAYCSRTAESSAEFIGKRTIYAESGDICDTNFVDQFLQNVVDNLGVPQLLVNNAAIFGPVGSVLTFSEVEITEVMRTNLIGPQNMCKAFLAMSNDSRHRAIVNIGGAGIGGRNPEKLAFPYLVSKSSLYWFTELLAEELRDRDTSVNLLAPGAMPTDFMAHSRDKAVQLSAQTFLDDLDRRKKIDSDEMYDRIHAWIEFLADASFRRITGRFLSAQWDNPYDVLSATDSLDAFRLRRIDNTMFRSVDE